MNCLLLLWTFLFFTSCGLNAKFDKLIEKQHFESAYQILETSKNKVSISFQERKLKILLLLTICDYSKYLPLLEDFISEFSEKSNILEKLVCSYIDFMIASEDRAYENIILNIPKNAMKDKQMEKLRLVIYGHSLLKLDKFAKILYLLEKNKKYQSNSDLLYIQSIAYWNLKNYTQAKYILQKLIKQTDSHKLLSLSYFYMGDIFEKEYKIKESMEYYLRAWKINPYYPELNYRIGRILQKSSYGELSHRFYRAALHLNENIADAWYYLNN